jgi:ribosome modulation factor
MKRQKRDPSHRAYVKGYQAGFNMRTKSHCPHQENSPTGQEWLRGWSEGRRDHWQGYNMHACQQKVSAL